MLSTPSLVLENENRSDVDETNWYSLRLESNWPQRNIDTIKLTTLVISAIFLISEPGSVLMDIPLRWTSLDFSMLEALSLQGIINRIPMIGIISSRNIII